MLEYMDEIVAAVEEFTAWIVDVAAGVIITLTKAVILFTAPAWILPYVIWRRTPQDNSGERCEKPDCKRCPFLPCMQAVEPERRGRE